MRWRTGARKHRKQHSGPESSAENRPDKAAAPLTGGTHAGWIVRGWFTDDPVYRSLAQQLAASLERVGAPYHLACVPKAPRGWEANTMQKPVQALAALDRHPGRTVVFMDVDFTATGDLCWLADTNADITLQMGVKRRRSGLTQMGISSRVVVMRPTPPARDFVTTWCRHSTTSRVFGDTDEATLKLTMGTTHGWLIGAIDKDRLHGCLTHHWASRMGTRMLGPIREMVNLLRPAWLAGLLRPRLTQ
jgi:hypothetical protein